MDVYCSSSLGPIVFLTFEAIYELGWTIASLNQVTISIHICGWLCLVTTPFGAAGSLPIRSAMAMKKRRINSLGCTESVGFVWKLRAQKYQGIITCFCIETAKKLVYSRFWTNPRMVDCLQPRVMPHATRITERMDQGRNLFLFFLIWLVGGLHSFAWLMVYLGLWLPKIPK